MPPDLSTERLRELTAPQRSRESIIEYFKREEPLRFLSRELAIELLANRERDICDVCCGKPLAPNLWPCICGGTASKATAFDNLRKETFDLQERESKLVEALRPFAEGGAVDCILREDYMVMQERLVDWFGPSDFKTAAVVLAEYDAHDRQLRLPRERRQRLGRRATDSTGGGK